MLYATTVTNANELQQILDLQQVNLKQNISAAEKAEQGFLTMSFNMPMLLAMHNLAPSIIVKNDLGNVVAYAITFLTEGRSVYPQMEPMFEHLTTITWKGTSFTNLRYYIMGQICVGKEVRGQGVFDMLYLKHREEYRHRFDCIVTEIATSNQRSLRAHARVGFETISRHKDAIDDWEVVAWDYRNP
jgi:GNAT superfamily N-acetyltransferase